MKILIQSIVLPHYRIPFFNKLIEKNCYDLSVVYSPYGNKNQNSTGIEHSQIQKDFKENKAGLIRINLLNLKFYYQKGLLRAIKVFNPDVYITQTNQFEISSILALLYCKYKKIPIVFWTKGYADTSKRNYFIDNFIMKPMLSLGDIYLPYGNSTIEYLVSLGIHKDRIITSFNTVDVERISNNLMNYKKIGQHLLAEQKIEESSFIISTVGRLVSKKNVIQLCFSIKKLVDKGYSVIGLIGGYGPEENNIRDVVEKLNLEDSVLLLGKLPNDHDNVLLAISDLAVFCGANGLAILQAMALKVPVLIADETGADSEVVRHLNTGIRFEKNNINEIVYWIEKVINNEINITKIVADAEKEVLGKRNLDKYVSAMSYAIQKVYN